MATRTSNFETIRPSFFAVMWLFLSIPLISAIYKKYSREEVQRELTTSAFLILAIYIMNAGASTVMGYSPNLMYGITSGVLYGNLYATDFNIIAPAVFIVLLSVVSKRNLLYFSALVISFLITMLSFRRSVMGLCLLALAVVVFLLMNKKNSMKLVVFGAVSLVMGLVVAVNTNFMTVFVERYEQRKLAERELGEETRFLEYDILYKDMFVYQDYDPLFGYELLNSAGNYGKGILDERSLHSDVTNIVHSTGIIGLILYLLMVASSFWKAFENATNKTDTYIFLYCAAAFIVYTITGRYTSVECTILLFLLLYLPLAKENEDVEEKNSMSEPKQQLQPKLY
ncbi:O-antigen ligase family protein [Pontibacter roseus]|uniref:O-antigen ligase family protein n=1 Tax=Pontibacter roseus TaxID=336989 RepID=UPI0014616648|nr:O-antigen ligase family protein [Pontibacter roseus]